MSAPATLDDIRAAAKRIQGHAHRTPIHTSLTLDGLAGRELFFKCENFQRVGAFKFRGAFNAVSRLSEATAKRGVVTHSSGNHAQALAVAAQLRGVPAHIVMPRTAPRVKREAVEGYGAFVYDCEPTVEDRERGAAQVVERTGGTLIPPFDHPDIIAGQGTVALELYEQVPKLDAIVAPVGGGGLISGIALGARELDPKIHVFAAEPRGADDAFRSKQAGELLPNASTSTIADGLLTNLGKLTWPVIRDHVQEVLLVSDDEIARAMRLVWERMKLVIEPSAAVPVAAVLSSRFSELPYQRVGVVLSGGNVDLQRLPWT